MADLNPLSMLNAALTGVGTDIKGRMDSDLSDEMLKSGANFTDVMMARITARQNTSDDLKDIQKDYSDTRTRPEWVDQLRHARADDTRVEAPVRDKQVAKPRAERVDGARTETVAAKDDADWSDDRAVKGLKKLASTMLDADKEGKISLPPSIKEVLQKIAAADETPGQILPLVQDMLGALRKLDMKLDGDALKTALGDMTWPPELTDLFKDLQVNPGAKSGQPIELGKLIKALRTLGNLVQQNAISKADKQAMIEATLLVAGEKKLVSPATDLDDAKPSDALAKTDTDTTATVPAKDVVDVLMGTPQPALVPVADKPAGHSVTPSVAKSDDTNLGAGDLVAGMAKGARQDRNPSMANGGQGDAAARSGAAGAAGASGSANSPLSLQFENQPALNPVAAALSARSSFTAGVAQAAAGNNATAPHPATQQVIVSLQKGAITKDTSLSIQLNPAELGRVDVKITIDQHGKASAQILADRPETLAMLQKDSSHLEKALQAAGLNSSAQDLHYSLREQNSQQRGQEFAGQKRRRALFDTDEGSQKVSMDAPLAADGLPHRVNYHA